MGNKIEFLESKVKELEKDKTAYQVHTANIEQQLMEKQKRIEELREEVEFWKIGDFDKKLKESQEELKRVKKENESLRITIEELLLNK